MTLSLAGAEERTGRVQDWALFARLLGMLMPYSRRVAASVSCALVDMGLQVLGPLVISVAVDRYFLRRTNNTGALRLWLPEQRDRGLAILSLVYLSILLLSATVQILQTYLAGWTGEKAMADLRAQLFAYLQKLDIAFFDSNPVGRIVTRVTTDVEALSEMFSGGIVGLAANLVMVIFFLAAMVRISPWLTVILAIILPVFAMMTVIFRRAVTPTQHATYLDRANQRHARGAHQRRCLAAGFNREEPSSREFDLITYNILRLRSDGSPRTRGSFRRWS